ncbi:MAG: BlaI/MecI/CopY family transcriptional regulator [Planctomycetaceae bacterium]|nr:BlaI/MecI/CopY family transcriptional regulator [Planctomycetaceae bacterium]
MSRPESEHPTELELEILKVLWDESPLPVRDVRERLREQAGRPLAHSSVITMLNIMHRKGYLKRKKDGKSFLFWPAIQKEGVAGSLLGDLVSRLFDGSTSAMMLSLLETSDLDSTELTQIRQMIARKAKETGK